MLRITTAESGEGATKYFDSALGRSDYYGVELGMWGGCGAERLGLEHEVSRDDFVALAMNKVPGTLEKLTVRDKETRRAGYDFCFSVPKSISIYLAETGDKAVERMIHESFRETMADVEERMETRVRAGDSDYDRTTGNMVYASFVHRETRPIDGAADPHYHIHGFTFNATFDGQENRWKAGQFGNIKADAPFYEASFNATLAGKLIEAGYAIRRTDRDFELASVSRELIEKFSKRTQQIEELARQKYTVLNARARALAKQTGMEFADAFAQIKSELGAESREKKSSGTLDPEEQLAHWRSQMTPTERDSLREGHVKGVSQNLLESETAKELAIEHLFERASVARALHAAGMLLRRGIGRVSVEAARAFAATDSRFIRVGELVTTREVRAEEAAFVQTALAGQAKHEPIGRAGNWEISPQLGEEQARAVQTILGSRDLVTTVHGPAGSGKTTLMREAVKAVETLSGKDVIVLAPSASAVAVLKGEGFARSETFQMFQIDSLLQDVGSGQILWVDEAGFLSAKQMNWLVQFADREQCRLILSGDTRQHHGVERGDALRVLENSGAVTQAALSKIVRQQIEALRDAVSDLSEGRAAEGFDKLKEFGAAHELEDKTERLAAIAELHLAARAAGKSSLIVAPTHAECRAIADAVRNQQRMGGILGAEDHAVTRLGKLNLTISQKRDPINYDVGQVIEFHRRAKGGFKSGERWEVARAELGAAVVVAKAGEEKLLPLDQANTFDLYVTEQISLAAGDAVRITKNFRAGGSKFRNNELCTVKAINGEKITLSDDRVIASQKALHLDQGIAVTSHASQGKTVDQVIVSAPVPAFSQVNSAQFYVSMSRARHAMHLFTDSIAALREAVCRPSERLSPLELELRAAESPPWTNHPRIERQRTNDIEIENEHERER
jgi:conjugative relaxase-like TrwC/TraI family protein